VPERSLLSCGGGGQNRAIAVHRTSQRKRRRLKKRKEKKKKRGPCRLAKPFRRESSNLLLNIARKGEKRNIERREKGTFDSGKRFCP